MCDGSDVPLALVHDRLVVGDVLGEVPQAAPAVPLQRDLDRIQRRLRLRPEALERELELDLRKENDAERAGCCTGCGCWAWPGVSRRSRGGAPARSGRRGGCGGSRSWPCGSPRPGCGARPCSPRRRPRRRRTPSSASGLADVTALAERCLLAELPDALPTVMQILADRAALDADVGHLAQALPALVRSLRSAMCAAPAPGPWRRWPRVSPSASSSALPAGAPRWTRRRPRRCGAMWTRCTERWDCWAR